MKKNKNKLIVIKTLLFSLLITTNTLYGTFLFTQEETGKDSTKGKWGGIPILFSSTLTGFAGGAQLGYIFKLDGTDRQSSIGGVVIYSQKKQLIIGSGGEIYWREYLIEGGIEYTKFPLTFYGIGNDTKSEDSENFTPETIGLRLGAKKNIFSSFRTGFLYEIQKHKLKKFEENGLIAQRTIPGTEDDNFTLSGIGAGLTWDTRDHTFYTKSGSYYQFSAILYDGVIGSKYSFKQYNIDLRKYFPLFSSHTLAFQSTMNVATNGAPAQKYSALGDDRLRGYSARYMDKNIITFQTEYRLPLWGKFGFAGFAGVGDVSDKLSHFQSKEFKFGMGFGIRYLIIPEEKINLRLDIGMGQDDNGSFSIIIGEAF